MTDLYLTSFTLQRVALNPKDANDAKKVVWHHLEASDRGNISTLKTTLLRANHDLTKTYPDLKGRIEVEEIVRTEGLLFWKLQFGSELNQKLSRDVGNLQAGVLFNKISEIMLRVTTKGVAQHDWKINL